MTNIKPTRMGLLISKKKLKLAAKGHKLLKEKRDALVMEFFKLLREIKSLRSKIAESLQNAQNALYRAQAMQGEIDVERFTAGSGSGVDIEFSERNIMGVKIPTIDKMETKHEWFGYFESTIELDRSVVLYRKLLPNLMKLFEKQLALDRLAKEIQSTKRKVNSLEYIIIPRMEKMKRLIAFKLEEMERENFTRLKKIKDKSAANAA